MRTLLPPQKGYDRFLKSFAGQSGPLRKKAEEVISYQIPTFKYHGPLVFFAAFRNHCSFYVVSKSIMETFSSELRLWDTSGTTIHFSAKNPLPVSLVKKIVKARIEENEARAKNT